MKWAFVLGIGFHLSAFAGNFTCENKKYRLEIDSAKETATVTHLLRPQTTEFQTEKFQKKGTKIPRYHIKGEGRALRYEDSPSEHSYKGEAVIRTSARIVEDDIVHSAEFLVDYDPYYTVTQWDKCDPGL